MWLQKLKFGRRSPKDESMFMALKLTGHNNKKKESKTVILVIELASEYFCLILT